MKNKLLCLLLVVVYSICNVSAQTYNCYIANDHLVSPTQFEFDVYIQTTSTDFSLRTIQSGFTINPAFTSAGAVYNLSIITGSSELVNFFHGGTSQQNSTPSLSAFDFTVNTNVNCGTGTIITNTGPTTYGSPIGPVRFATMRIISSLPFNCVPHNLSMILPTQLPPGGNVFLNCAVSKWDAIDCSIGTTSTINNSGTFTNFVDGTLYSLVNNMRPVFTINPVPTSACINSGTAVFSASASNGTLSPTSYQWLENGIPISDIPPYSGTNTSILTITAPSGTLDGKIYSCEASQCSPALTRTSLGAMLTVNAVSSIYVTQSGPTSFCQGGSVTLTAGGGAGYSWNTGETNQSISVNSSGNYFVSSPGCSASSPVNVNVYTPPSPNPNSNTPVCSGTTVILSSNGGIDYSWTGPNNFVSTLQNPTISNAALNQAGSYSVTVTDANGCTGSAATNIAIGACSIIIDPVPGRLCAGNTESISFNSTPSFFHSGNIFYAQLSNASGSFSSPVTIGSLNSTVSGTINLFIPVNIPAGSGYRIRVVSSNPPIISADNGSNIVIDAAVHPNTWTVKPNFAGSARFETAYFVIGSIGYVGTGNDASGYKKDFWEFNPSTNVWTQKSDFGGTARSEASGFSIGTKGYIGTGLNGSGLLSDFWEYNQSTNSWTQKANYPFVCRNAVGFAIGSKGYIGTGRITTGNTYSNSFIEYDPSNNTWIAKANFPGLREGAVGFSIGNKGFMGTGYDGTFGTYKKDFWEYSQSLNSWLSRSDLPGNGCMNAVGFSIGTKGYIGTGAIGSTLLNDFYEYNGFWSTKTAVPNGTGRYGAIGLSIDGMGYIGTGWTGIRASDFYKYEPDPGLLIDDISPLNYCAGDSVFISYKIAGSFQCGNSFIAQLSDAGGSFSSAVNIDTSASLFSGTMRTIIPFNTPIGSGYRIRVISTNPVQTSANNGSNISVQHCEMLLQLKLFIEGFYLGNGIMNASVDPVNHPTLSDTIIVELHDINAPHALAYSSKDVISTSGSGTFNFPYAAGGNSYYIVIRHRNSIETWSASPVILQNNLSYDFSNLQSKAYGSNLSILGDGNYALFSGDISDPNLGPGFQDGIIESQDYSDLENAVYLVLTGYIPQDISGDGVVESLDYSIMENNVYFVIVSMYP